MSIFFYDRLNEEDIITLSVGDSQIRYKIEDISEINYRRNQLEKTDKRGLDKQTKYERGNLFSILFEDKQDLLMQTNFPSRDGGKTPHKLIFKLSRLD